MSEFDEWSNERMAGLLRASADTTRAPKPFNIYAMVHPDLLLACAKRLRDPEPLTEEQAQLIRKGIG